MKPSRLLLLGLLVAGPLVLAVAGLVFNADFQTWAARRALAGQPGLDVTLGRVSAGLNQVRLANVRMRHRGAILTLPALELEAPVLPAWLKQKYVVHRLEAKGWTLDLTHLAKAPVAAMGPVMAPPVAEFSLLPSAYGAVAATLPPVVFSGIFHQLRLPVDLSLDRVDLAGEVLLPARPDRPAARAKVTLTGGNLAAGHPGQFDYTAVIQFEGEGATVRELRVSGTLGVVMDTPRSVSRFVAATAAEAAGPQLPEGVRLAVDVSAAQTAAGENYAVAVLAGRKQLAAIEASYAAGESHLRGTWRLDMHDRDLAPFVLGRELPVFEAAGDGRFDVDTTFTELNASGRLKTSASRLGTIDPGLAVLGAVQLAADFDLAQHGNATRIDRLAVSLIGAKPVGTVQALQPFEFNLQTGELNVADPSRELLGVVLQGVPLAWVDPFLARTGLVLTGNDLRGEIAASARNGGFTLRSKLPLAITNLSVALPDGRPLVRAVDVSLEASADYAPQGWQVECSPLTVSSQGVRLLDLRLKAGQLAGKNQPVKLAGDWDAQLPALLTQPPVDGAVALTGGESRGDFAASLGEKRSVQLRLDLTHLMSATLGALPSLQAELRADLEKDGQVTFNAPLVFELAGRKSDLTFAGTLATGPGGVGINARLTGELLAVEDVKTFALPLIAALDAPARPGRIPGRETPRLPAAPFWRGVTGQCTVALKQVLGAEQLQVSAVSGLLQLDAASLKLSDGRAGFGPDSAVRLSGGLTYSAAGPQTYGFAGDVALTNFDLAPVFRALDPSRPPTVEGRVDLVSHLTGAGATLEELAGQTRGDLRLTGKSGVFRALAADLSDRIQRTQSRVVAIGNLLGVLTDDYVNKSKILADIARSLSEIPYDQLSLTATRDASLNLQLRDFSLISPEVRLGGHGVIRYVPGVPVVSQALDLQFNLGVRGRLGDLMKRAGLLEAQQDTLGYAAFGVPLRLGGTVARPDTSAIRDALLNSALERSGLLDSLFNRGK